MMSLLFLDVMLCWLVGSFLLDCLTLADGKIRLSRNVSNYQLTLCNILEEQRTQKTFLLERQYQEKWLSFLFQNHAQGALLRENWKLALLLANVRKWLQLILWWIYIQFMLCVAEKQLSVLGCRKPSGSAISVPQETVTCGKPKLFWKSDR